MQAQNLIAETAHYGSLRAVFKKKNTTNIKHHQSPTYEFSILTEIEKHQVVTLFTYVLLCEGFVVVLSTEFSIGFKSELIPLTFQKLTDWIKYSKTSSSGYWKSKAHVVMADKSGLELWSCWYHPSRHMKLLVSSQSTHEAVGVLPANTWSCWYPSSQHIKLLGSSQPTHMTLLVPSQPTHQAAVLIPANTSSYYFHPSQHRKLLLSSQPTHDATAFIPANTSSCCSPPSQHIKLLVSSQPTHEVAGIPQPTHEAAAVLPANTSSCWCHPSQNIKLVLSSKPTHQAAGVISANTD